MADALTAADSMRVYLTGATSHGAAQLNPDASLGLYRSCRMVEQLAFRRVNPISGITVEFVAGANGTGTGALTAIAASSIQWTPPGGSPGDAVTIANGETKILEGSDADQYIRVTRTSATALGGNESIITFEVLHNAIAGDEVGDTEATAGSANHRAVAVANVRSSGDLTSVSAWLEPLGTEAVSSGAQLGLSGAGTITFAANALDDWPAHGFARIRETGGTFRETIYYTSRTDNDLTVPAAGRELIGTAAAGAGTDIVTPVAGFALFAETPTANALDDSTADESTGPTSPTWNGGYDAASGVSLGTIAADAFVGLWIKQLVPAGMVAEHFAAADIRVAYTAGVTAYEMRLPGRYRVVNDALAGILIYRGSAALPDFDAAAWHFEAGV